MNLHVQSVRIIRKETSPYMFGWMMIFMLMTLAASMSAIHGSIGSAAGMTSGLVFGFLLVVSALTLVLRGRA